MDRLSIQDVVAVRFENVAVTSFGTSNEHTRIVYEDIVVELLGVSRALQDPQDLVLGVA